jgi:hypothetical protein
MSTLLTGCFRYFQQNTGNVVNLLDAMRVHNVNKFIYSSTCATYGDHDEMPITEETVQVGSLPRCPHMSAFGFAGKPIFFLNRCSLQFHVVFPLSMHRLSFRGILM